MPVLPFNPYKPGAGHMPPYLAGRQQETDQFRRLLSQETIIENMVLTGLRGVGKTVLLETFKPIAIEAGWRWVGTDLSESASVSEDALSRRLLTDLSVATSRLTIDQPAGPHFGFGDPAPAQKRPIDFDVLNQLFERTPGLMSDKIKAVLENVWSLMGPTGARGIIFAYDEAQNMSDRPKKEQYPLATMLDVFQSIQRKGIPFMLVLTGLPTLFPKLVEARTFAERMFHVVVLGRLSRSEARDAILKPFDHVDPIIPWSSEVIRLVVESSGCYPYFIQFIC